MHELLSGLTEHAQEHGGAESLLAVLAEIIRLEGRVPVMGHPNQQQELYCAATLAKERLVTDWSGGKQTAPAQSRRTPSRGTARPLSLLVTPSRIGLAAPRLMEIP